MSYTVRFATPELEEQDRVDQANVRAEKRQDRLTRAIHSHIFNTGIRGLEGAAHFFITKGEAALVEIDAALDAAKLKERYVPQIGHCWRVLVGPRLALRVGEIAAEPEDVFAQYKLPKLVAVEPWLEVMCVGGERMDDYADAAGDAAFMVPINKDTHRSCRTPKIRIPVAYLLTHGMRTT